MDLFYADVNEEAGEWIDIKIPPKLRNCKIKLKLKDHSECFAYYYDSLPLGIPSKAHWWLANRHDQYLLEQDILSYKYLRSLKEENGEKD